MKYYGTREPERLYSMRQAATVGLAPCGGLFMPVEIPQIDLDVFLQKAEQSFPEMALYVAGLFFKDDIDESKLREIVFDAFDFPITLTPFGALELFHGPTLAFKDFGARFMGRMLEAILERDMVILTATSGDTGSAVANGFFGSEAVRVVVLYPDGKVSDFQERQMTTLGSNITSYAVDGTFDDCQRMVKEVFADTEFCAEHGITSANSISILRWIPQSFYYFYGYYLWLKQGGVGACEVTVPSGNFGNITAAMLAKRMGLPLSMLRAATNANDTMPLFVRTRNYIPKPSVQTLSNAMDVGDPSNFERLMALYAGVEMSDFEAQSYTDEQTQAAMREIYAKYGYVSDPHSAVAYLAHRGIDKGFYVSTAHPVKFESVIKDTLDLETDYPEQVRHFFEREKQVNRLTDLRTALINS